ncbi:MAG: hypothetical protein OXB93_00310 [Cytophagales bacterium]|nr:hypothetical protein [Cytophagales bacterium]
MFFISKKNNTTSIFHRLSTISNCLGFGLFFIFLISSCNLFESDEVETTDNDEGKKTDAPEAGGFQPDKDWYTEEAFLGDSPFSGERKLRLKDGSALAKDQKKGIPSALSSYDSDFLEDTDYIGAVSPSGTPWYAESSWSMFGHLIDEDATKHDKVRSQPTDEEVINDAAFRTAIKAADGKLSWSKDKVYILEGLVFVEDGETLSIEKGTVIKGRKQDAGKPGSSLIISRGGKIIAEGTAEEPIIFTFEEDPLDGSTSPDTRGKWGGLILLGKAKLNSAPGETAIEGIPTGETRGLYGGSDDNDNSGTLRYVSIRHAGTELGAGNEINSLTLGAVGNQTSISYIEVVGGKDDGIEWFGGTVRIKYAISAYCADDALDYDEGFRGISQFVIVFQDLSDGGADRGGEHDGGTKPETAEPFAIPLFANLSSLGNPNSRTITFRDNAGGHYFKSIFQGYGKGIDIEFLPESEQDSYLQYRNGNISFFQSYFHGLKVEKNKVFSISTPE